MKQETETKAAETVETKAPETDVWAETKEVFLPKAGVNEQKFEFVGVNGRTFQVPRGKRVEVPLPVYEVLENARLQTESAEADAEELQKQAQQ
jgi:hypothetical protein